MWLPVERVKDYSLSRKYEVGLERDEQRDEPNYRAIRKPIVGRSVNVSASINFTLNVYIAHEAS